MLTLPKYDPQDDMFLSLTHVALKIRGDMMATTGHQDFSVTRIMQYHAFQIVYTLLRIIVVVKRP